MILLTQLFNLNHDSNIHQLSEEINSILFKIKYIYNF